MDSKTQNNVIKPNYKKIYTDLILKKFPEKMSVCLSILEKDNFCLLDIFTVNKLIFDIPGKETSVFNQKLRSYDEETIEKILTYQMKYRLNNTQVANHFKLSRNSIAKWKKIYQVKC
ncbi:transposase [Chryseobacterium sp. BLS98]|jgi:hypothetical protein|nr:transposase [Chryseobacterium sp. BLS98]